MDPLIAASGSEAITACAKTLTVDVTGVPQIQRGYLVQAADITYYRHLLDRRWKPANRILVHGTSPGRRDHFTEKWHIEQWPEWLHEVVLKYLPQD